MPKIKDEEPIDQQKEDKAAEKQKFISSTLRNIPSSWSKILKEEGFTFSGYAKQAIRRAMIQDGFLKPLE